MTQRGSGWPAGRSDHRASTTAGQALVEPPSGAATGRQPDDRPSRPLDVGKSRRQRPSLAGDVPEDRPQLAQLVPAVRQPSPWRPPQEGSHAVLEHPAGDRGTTVVEPHDEIGPTPRVDHPGTGLRALHDPPLVCLRGRCQFQGEVRVSRRSVLGVAQPVELDVPESDPITQHCCQQALPRGGWSHDGHPVPSPLARAWQPSPVALVQGEPTGRRDIRIRGSARRHRPAGRQSHSSRTGTPVPASTGTVHLWSTAMSPTAAAETGRPASTPDSTSKSSAELILSSVWWVPRTSTSTR